MSLDAHVRCLCIREGKARPHPLKKRLTFDERGEPILDGDLTDREWNIHEKWLEKCCEHGGYQVITFLGNITLAKHLRELVRHLQSDPGPKFPILLKQVLYNGTHTGDAIPSKQAPALLEEVNTILHSQDILSEAERQFFLNMKNLCQASIETGNQIVF